MGAINAYEGGEFPGAQASIEADLDGTDCANFATFELLVEELQTDSNTACTIRNGRAYTIQTVGGLSGQCTP